MQKIPEYVSAKIVALKELTCYKTLMLPLARLSTEVPKVTMLKQKQDSRWFNEILSLSLSFIWKRLHPWTKSLFTSPFHQNIGNWSSSVFQLCLKTGFICNNNFWYKISGYLIMLPQTWFVKYCSTLISNFNRDFLWKFELRGIPFKTMVLTRF